MTRSDSAGRSFGGRSFSAAPSPWAGDDGSAPAGYLDAVSAFRAGRAPVESVVDVLSGVRLLVPLLAGLAEAGVADDGRTVDKEAELALVTVAGPDGRRVLPAFSSAASMQAWNPAARPIPAPARQVALGAAGDGTELVIVDPASPERFGLRRSALEALARDVPWVPPWSDAGIGRAVRAAVAGEPDVTTARVSAGDPEAVFAGPEVLVTIVLHETLDQQRVAELLARVQRRWTEDPLIRARVDSMTVRLEASFC